VIQRPRTTLEVRVPAVGTATARRTIEAEFARHRHRGPRAAGDHIRRFKMPRAPCRTARRLDSMPVLTGALTARGTDVGEADRRA
jgi:hypothetical protein